MYAYLNAILNANPAVTSLVLATDAYAVATGPVPPGEEEIPSRVTVAEQPVGAVPLLSQGFASDGSLVVQFFA